MYLKQEIEQIPKAPGCYLFKNKHGEIIYIGKSKALRNRVRQYFYPATPKPSEISTRNLAPLQYAKNLDFNKYIRLAREIHEISTIVTDTETSALILECQLIKRHKPRYNSQLKESQPYPFIRISVLDEYPAIAIVDCIADDRCRYFGGFYDFYDAKDWVELLSSIWQTPCCLKHSFLSESRPCLNNHLGKCLAPCGQKEKVEQYNERISEMVRCLDGDFESTLYKLNSEMTIASNELDFEGAAKLRDQIQTLNQLRKRQRSFLTQLKNRKVYLYFRAYNERCFTLFFINDGHTLNRMDFRSITRPSKKQLEQFVVANWNKEGSTEDSKFLTDCLLDIRADKYFLSLCDTYDLKQTVDELLEAFYDYMGEDSRQALPHMQKIPL